MNRGSRQGLSPALLLCPSRPARTLSGSQEGGQGSKQPGSLLLHCASSFPRVTLFLAAAPRLSAPLLPWLQHHPQPQGEVPHEHDRGTLRLLRWSRWWTAACGPSPPNSMAASSTSPTASCGALLFRPQRDGGVQGTLLGGLGETLSQEAPPPAIHQGEWKARLYKGSCGNRRACRAGGESQLRGPD